MQIARRYCNVKSANCFTAIKHSIEEGDVGGWEWGRWRVCELIQLMLNCQVTKSQRAVENRENGRKTKNDCEVICGAPSTPKVKG